MKATLGKLERISLRKAWAHEAGEFTPWLAEPDNLTLLAESVGLSELELVRTEHPVGDFSVDILCMHNGENVIIENQLAKTDHGHLGQLLTYAAGVGARKVIWVAESFRTEHVAALDFLNQHTSEELAFFAVEIELWCIGDSPMAPSFNVVVKPNDWARTGQRAADSAGLASPSAQRYMKFWTEYIGYLKDHQSPLRTQEPRPTPRLSATLGRSDFLLNAVILPRQNALRLAIRLSRADSIRHLMALLEDRPKIEAALGFALKWEELENEQACRISIERPNCPIADESQWQSYFAWLSDNGAKLDKVFRPLIRAL